MINMNNKKTKKIISTIVVVLVVAAMVIPMILGSFCLLYTSDAADE